MSKSIHLDLLDRKILGVLQRQAEISHAALAEQVGASPASCWRRIKALETAGVLGAAVRLLDAAAIGRGLVVVCQVRMKTHDRETRAGFQKFVEAHPAIMECYSMSGEWDYLLRVVVAEVSDYEHFLMRELLGQSAVATSASHFALSQIKYTTAMPL